MDPHALRVSRKTLVIGVTLDVIIVCGFALSVVL
jgi:hypothetical protein